ncbi:MAG: NADH:ubiquinone oxidoreductase subunit NDUFA12 [Aestuariivita sp.]|nr:NADH:ubiquinone oxidoreductase subunit NDUFA12 [Aestuariivita sp.]
MQIVNLVKRALTWWDGQTLNTQFYTWRKGIRVGEDNQGNVYYRTKDDRRRWVIYKGESEASRVSPEWHGWLHHTWDVPPSVEPLPRKSWEKPHQENLTGTDDAYVPLGSLRQVVPKDQADYIPWTPP